MGRTCRVADRRGQDDDDKDEADHMKTSSRSAIANGEPVGASGLRQVYENVLQLRGDAGKRQVPGDPKVAYTHVYGAPGISAVTILQS